MLGTEVARAFLDVPEVEVIKTSRVGAPGLLRFDAECSRFEDLFTRPIDLVVNCAGVLAHEIDPLDPASARRAEIVNAAFPHELAHAAGERDARLVHVSTDAVFRPDAGRCYEDDDAFSQDVYGVTKRRGEPHIANALSLRCSFIGRDPRRSSGLLDWFLRQPPGSEVPGHSDRQWNGVTTPQVAAVCAALLDRETFDRARLESAVHHLFEDPPLTKHELLVFCAGIFARDVSVIATPSGTPSTRVLGTRHAVLRECLECGPGRSASLERMAKEEPFLHG